MRFNTRHIIWYCMLTTALPVSAQLPVSVKEAIENLPAEQAEEPDTDFLLDHFSDLYENPLNLNSADQKELEASLLFSPFQIHQILSYREKYGDFFSLFELVSIPGFSEERVLEINPFLSVTTVIHQQKSGKSEYSLVSDIQGIYPVPEGYGADSSGGKAFYAGSSFRYIARFKANLNDRVFTGLTFEKDRGETFLVNHGPQFISGYAEIRNLRIVKKVVAGNFKVQSGMGLVAGTGFNPSLTSYSLNMISPLQIKSCASVSETNYLTGLALNIQINKLESIVWVSHTLCDLSLPDYDQNSPPHSWKPMFRETGLHRTGNEIRGTALAFSQSAGLILNRKFNRLMVGGIICMDRNGLTRKGLDSLELTKATSTPLPGAGASLLWFNRKTTLFGELAIYLNGETALLGGTKYILNDYLNAALIFRHYSRNYTGLQPSAYAMGSKLQNETGPGIYLEAHPFRHSVLKFTLDYCNFPWLKYRVDAPSAASCYNIEFVHLFETASLRAAYSSRQWMINDGNTTYGIPLLARMKRERLRMQVSVKLSEQFSWSSRLDISLLYSGAKKNSGYMMYHEITGTLLEDIHLKWRYVLFQIDDWENRIYCYEPGLRYGSRFTALYGSGSEFTGIIQLKVFRGLQLGMKNSLTLFRDRNEIGSGNDMIRGNRKWESGFQLVWKY